jgi:RHS repeat-associated protein
MRRKFLGCLILCAVTLVAYSQTTPDPTPGFGDVPYRTYLGENERINVATGVVTIQIPLVTLPGRNGFDYVYKFTWNSPGWHVDSVSTPNGTQYFWVSSGGWLQRAAPNLIFDTNVVPPDANNTYRCNGNWRLAGTDGRVIFFPAAATACQNAQTGVAAPSVNQLTATAGQGPYASGSASIPCSDFMSLSLNGSISKVVKQNGEVLWFENGGAGLSTRDVDSNGNVISFPTTGTSQMVDTAGRSISKPPLITYTDSNGNTQTITQATQNVQRAPVFNNQVPDPTPSTVSLLSSIVLANGGRYDFEYNNYLELIKITYPSGGYTKYDWGFAANSRLREILAKHVCRDYDTRANGGTCSQSEDTTTFTPTISQLSSNLNATSIVRNAALDETDFAFSSSFESQRKVFSGTGTPLKTIDSVISCLGPSQVKVTLDDGQVSMTQWDHLDPYVGSDSGGLYHQTKTYHTDNVTAWREYAYGSPNPALIRQTATSWMHTNPINGQDYTSTAIHILNRKLSEITQDNSQNRIAETDYEYDDYNSAHQYHAALVSSGAAQHDSGFSTSYTTRGNATAMKHWLNTTGAFLSTVSTYDDAGNVPSTTDPGGHTTAFSYTDNFTDGVNRNAKAYITQTTLPTTSSVSHISKRQYFYNTGLVAAACGDNFLPGTACNNTLAPPQSDYVKTTYDIINRPLVTTRGDGGQTTNCYSDTPSSSCPSGSAQISQTVTSSITPSLNKVDVSLLDGIGQVIQTKITSDTEGADIVDTTYDGIGRKIAVSNPHRPSAAPTDGITHYQYDGLNRVTEVAMPDGNTALSQTWSAGSACATNDICTTYSGNIATTKDQAGKSKSSQTDALGRLTAVWEDPSGLNYQTAYQYDLLDNLIRADQKGSTPNTSANWRTRTFAYDSLSRLLCSANPEIGNVTCPNPDNGAYTAGTLRYSYDADANVLTKTSPKPNQTSSSLTVVTTYSYDELHRLKQKSYNDGSTAIVKYGYDAVALSSCTTAPPGLTDSNPKGRRTAMCDASGATSWSHDQMGEVLQERRTIGSVVGKYTTYTYNLAGSIATVKDPISLKNITYTFNGAGRALTAKDLGTTINYVTGATYAPFGGLTGMINGSATAFAGITTTNSYNTRLQPAVLSGASPAATILSLSYNFHLGTGDNGNIFQIVNNRDNNRTQNFTYDTLNRIQQAYTTGPNWGETFSPTPTAPGVAPTTSGIDSWGNLTNRSGVTGKNNTEPLSQIATTQNRLTSFGYDAAGNTIQNGSTAYTYDAENRLTSTSGWTYVYDGDGNRARKSSGSSGILYWRGMGNDPLAESNLTGAGLEQYVFFNGKRIARRDISNGAVHYYFSDHLGSHAVVENATGTVCEQDIDYYPYGGIEQDYCPNVAQNYKFTGKERDAESGLDNFGARYDASSLGRFMTPDWNARVEPVPYANLEDPRTLNLYSYVQNNPLSKEDPDGHCDIDVGGGKTEHHWGWCIWHTLGLYQTQPEMHKEAEQWRKRAFGMMDEMSDAEVLHVVRTAMATMAPDVPPESIAVEALEITAANGTKIKGLTEHGVDRAIGDGAPGVAGARAGTRPEAILDALKNPESIKSGVDSQGRPFQVFTGQNARVVVNPESGKIVSVNPTSGAGAH